MSTSQRSSSLLNRLDAIPSLSPVYRAGGIGPGTSPFNAFVSCLSGLESAIHAGELDSTQYYLTQLELSHPAASKGKGPIGAFLNQVRQAISAGNVTAARIALTALSEGGIAAPPRPLRLRY